MLANTDALEVTDGERTQASDKRTVRTWRHVSSPLLAIDLLLTVAGQCLHYQYHTPTASP